MLYDVCMLDVYRKLVCYNYYLTYVYSKLGLILGAKFLQYIKSNILLI